MAVGHEPTPRVRQWARRTRRRSGSLERTQLAEGRRPRVSAMRGLARMARGAFRGGQPVDFPPCELHRVGKLERRLHIPDVPRKVDRPDESLLWVGEGKLIAR